MSDKIKNEVAEFIGNFKFPGKENKVEPFITFKGDLKLVMMVSGEKAALYRSAMVKILSRYYAGVSLQACSSVPSTSETSFSAFLRSE